MASERQDGNQYNSTRTEQDFTRSFEKRRNDNLIFRVKIGWFRQLTRAYFRHLQKMDSWTLQCSVTKVHILSLRLWHLHPQSVSKAVTAASGKLILAKYVHSENEKEEEEPVFVFFFQTLRTWWWGERGAGLPDKNSGGGNAGKVKV